MHVYVIFKVVEDASIWCIRLYLAFGVLYSWQDDNFKYSLHLTAFSAAWETFNGDEPPTENLLLHVHSRFRATRNKSCLSSSFPSFVRVRSHLFHTSSLPLSPLLVKHERCLIRLVSSGAWLVAVLKTRLAKKRMESAGFELGPPASWAI